MCSFCQIATLANLTVKFCLILSTCLPMLPNAGFATRQHKVLPTINVGLRKFLPCISFIYIEAKVKLRNESVQDV